MMTNFYSDISEKISPSEEVLLSDSIEPSHFLVIKAIDISFSFLWDRQVASSLWKSSGSELEKRD